MAFVGGADLFTGVAVQYSAVPAQDFCTGVAGNRFKSPVDRNNDAVDIDDHHPVLNRIHDGFPVVVHILFKHGTLSVKKFNSRVVQKLNTRTIKYQQKFALPGGFYLLGHDLFTGLNLYFN